MGKYFFIVAHVSFMRLFCIFLSILNDFYYKNETHTDQPFRSGRLDSPIAWSILVFQKRKMYKTNLISMLDNKMVQKQIDSQSSSVLPDVFANISKSCAKSKYKTLELKMSLCMIIYRNRTVFFRPVSHDVVQIRVPCITYSAKVLL